MSIPDLTTPVGRVMFAAGDHDSDDPLLPGGTAQYTALLGLASNNEELAWRNACQALAAYYAAQPTRISASGKSLSYDDRVPFWRDAANGLIAYPFAASGSGTSGLMTAGTEARELLR